MDVREISILIIGPPGRLRDGLVTILRTFSQITDIITADAFLSAIVIAGKRQPSIVIIDSQEGLEEDCLLLKQMLSENEDCRCVVIVNTKQQGVQAMEVGADAVLLNGFSTSDLQSSLFSPVWEPEANNFSTPQ